MKYIIFSKKNSGVQLEKELKAEGEDVNLITKSNFKKTISELELVEDKFDYLIILDSEDKILKTRLANIGFDVKVEEGDDNEEDEGRDEEYENDFKDFAKTFNPKPLIKEAIVAVDKKIELVRSEIIDPNPLIEKAVETVRKDIKNLTPIIAESEKKTKEDIIKTKEDIKKTIDSLRGILADIEKKQDFDSNTLNNFKQSLSIFEKDSKKGLDSLSKSFNELLDKTEGDKKNLIDKLAICATTEEMAVCNKELAKLLEEITKIWAQIRKLFDMYDDKKGGAGYIVQGTTRLKLFLAGVSLNDVFNDLNFVAGTGVTIVSSLDSINRKTNLTISATGSGTGTVDSVVAGTGISVDSTDPANPIVTNSAPDQTVAISAGTGISVTGTYPNFTVTNTSTGGTDEKVKYDASDPTASYLSEKIIAGTGITVGEGTGVNENKLVITNDNPTPYTLPTASGSVLGGIKVGTRLSIDGNGVLSADVQAGTGDVTGPSGATDNAIARYDTATGKLLQNSTVTIADDGVIENVNAIKLDTTPNAITPTVGQIYWDTSEGVPSVNLDTTNGVTLSLGTESYVRVVNKTGVQVNDGQVVYINGAQGNRPTIALAKADTVGTSRIIGVATQNIADNAEGFITISGDVHGYDTSSFAAGDVLYLSATTAGLLTKTAPASPNNIVIVATACNSINNGLITVHPQQPLAASSTLVDNSDLIAPTQKAVKTYADAKVADAINDGTTTVAPSQNAVFDALALKASTALVATKKPFHGVVSRTTDPLPANLTTTTFTLNTSTYPLSYYYQGTLVTVSTNKTTTLSGSAGLYFIYFDADSGNLTNSTVFPGIDCTSNVLIASVLWNGSNYGLVNDERHGMYRDCEWHKWAHSTVGTRYRSGITLTHNSGTGAAATFSTTAGEIWDEDIQFTVPASSTFPTANAGRLLYQTGASTYAFVTTPSTVPGYLGANNRPNYVTPAVYTLTQMSSAINRYINVFVYATTDMHTPIYFFTETVSAAVAASNGYTSLANARAAAFPNLAGQIGISAELKPIYRLIWRADGALQAIDTVQDDYRTVTSLPMSAGTTSTTASAVTFNASGNISATTVQTAIEELDSEKLDATTAGTTYAKLDGTNQPFTGNLNDSKADPEIRLTDTGDNEYARWTRTDTLKQVDHKARVDNATSSDLGTNLVVHYLMNDNAASTTVLDNMGAFNGTAQQNTSVLTTTGKINSALTFNSTTDYVSTNYAGVTGSGSRTVSFWFKTPASDTTQGIMFFYGTWGSYAGDGVWISINYGGGGVVKMDFDGGWTTSSSGIYNDGNWHHAVMTYDGTTISCFIDNASIGTQTRSLNTGTTYKVNLGYSPRDGLKFKGTLDDVRVYSRCLSAVDIAGLYNAGNGTESETSMTATAEKTYLSVKNGTAGTESATVTLGPTDSRTQIDGQTIRFLAGGTEKFATDTNGNLIMPDSRNIYLGTASDASVSFSGTSLDITSDLVTATDELNLRGGTNGIDFLIGSTEQISLNDGKLYPTTTNDIDLGDSTHLYKTSYLTTIELGHATDTTIARVSAGVASIEGKNIALNGTGETLTTGSIELGAASDTTISRVSAGVVAIEGKNILTTDGGTLTGNITLGENTSIDLDPAGSADGKYSGICITGTAGAALAFGDLIYLAAADSRWELTDADASATGGPVLIGMCVLAAAGDGSATKILLQGQIRADAKFPALTIGAPVYLGETAGAIQIAIPTGADNVIRTVGFALTADEIYFNPSQDHQLSVA